VQYEKNTEQGQTELSENEITFAQSLDDALEKALGTGDNVTSIWSHLKDEQRARLAADYLAALNTDSRKSSNFESNSSASPTTPEAPPEAQQGTAAAYTAPPANRARNLCRAAWLSGEFQSIGRISGTGTIVKRPKPNRYHRR
tara:strand:+ start:190 stop:618 length:429 start_codon:yes stop_codon:yes gene_type:complete